MWARGETEHIRTTAMKHFFVLFTVVAAAYAQSGGFPDLSTMSGIQQFLAMEGINPSSIVTSNCIANGNACSPSGGQPCCLSPVFTCQSNPLASGANQCMVIPAHVPHIPQIRQIINTFGVSTQNPVL